MLPFVLKLPITPYTGQLETSSGVQKKYEKNFRTKNKGAMHRFPKRSWNFRKMVQPVHEHEKKIIFKKKNNFLNNFIYFFWTSKVAPNCPVV